MVSISSKKAITERTKAYWEKETIWGITEPAKAAEKITSFLKNEYKVIPEKERIGKGQIFVAKAVAEGCFNLIDDKSDFDFIAYSSEIFDQAEKKDNHHLRNFALIILAESSTLSEEIFIKVLEKTKYYGDHPSWEVREVSAYSIRKGLKEFPDLTVNTLKDWLSPTANENMRRLVAESLRPLADTKWLRDPEKNGAVLEILASLRADQSEYVRKSVGNNLKDLSKYMPETVLEIAENWVREANITVDDELASKTRKELGEENYYLIWTLKHALRWLKSRNPEYYQRMEKILGRNYVLYFDEKRNKLARPS